MAQIRTQNWIVYKGAFLPAGTHQIDDKDVEAMRPYGEIIDGGPKGRKRSVKSEDDDILS